MDAFNTKDLPNSEYLHGSWITLPDDHPQLEAGVGAAEHCAHGDGGRQLGVQGAGQLPEHSPGDKEGVEL